MKDCEKVDASSFFNSLSVTTARKGARRHSLFNFFFVVDATLHAAEIDSYRSALKKLFCGEDGQIRNREGIPGSLWGAEQGGHQIPALRWQKA